MKVQDKDHFGRYSDWNLQNSAHVKKKSHCEIDLTIRRSACDFVLLLKYNAYLQSFN